VTQTEFRHSDESDANEWQHSRKRTCDRRTIANEQTGAEYNHRSLLAVILIQAGAGGMVITLGQGALLMAFPVQTNPSFNLSLHSRRSCFRQLW
jgi:hypothetical protein